MIGKTRSLDMNAFMCPTYLLPNTRSHVSSFPAVDGRFLSWTRWSPCSRSCGFKGFSVRSRSCTAPKHGGQPCYGAGIDTRECNRKHCPGKVRMFYTTQSQVEKKNNKLNNELLEAKGEEQLEGIRYI